MGGGVVYGGTGPAKDADPQVQALVDGLKDQIEKLAQAKGWNGIVTKLKVEKYKGQCVAGVNYFVKVTANENLNWHLRIYDHFSEPAVLTDMLIDVDADAPIDYF